MKPFDFPLLADENVAPDVVTGLRERKCNVRTVGEELIGRRTPKCWPAWSPDGRGRHLLSVAHHDEPSALSLRHLATNAVQLFVDHPTLWTYYPDWSSNGQFVAFSVSPAHHKGQDWDLAVTGVAAPHQFMRLTHGAGNDRLPDWKP